MADLFKAASLRPAAQWDDFLSEACCGDDQMRRELESLLRQPVSRDGLLEGVAGDVRELQRAAHLDGIAAGSSAPGSLPAAIGRYRVLGLVGEGGMGTVYEVEQDHPRRVVALKVMKAGLADAERLRRFQKESEALGRLQHPGIAQIYEAGVAPTGSGTQPYFAMEYIRGLSLVRYAITHRLHVRARLEIMAKVCEAVQHAHERGIIHRDLKPGNILVDESGQPKILDFGVARIIDSDGQTTRQTDLGQLVGTLAYMSPEQMLTESAELDRCSDVYALGVILYELLAGRLPYTVSPNLLEAARTIREEEPTPLGAVSREYRGDLETVVRKALEKEKLRRYATARDLAADLRHYLADEPILAQPPSATYQARKFARRHRALVSAAAAVFLVLLAGVMASTRQAIRANRERDRALRAEQTATLERQRAEQERNRAVAESQRADTESAVAKAVNEFLQNDLLAQAGASAQATPNSRPDPDLKVRTALDRAAARVEGKFTGRPAVEASIRFTIGETYFELGLYPEAAQQMERALELRRSALGHEHPDTLKGMRTLAGVYLMQAKYADAEALLKNVYETQTRLGRQDDAETLNTLNDLAEVASAKGDHARARDLLIGVVERQRRLLGEEHPDTLNALNNLALEDSTLDDDAQAEQLYEKALKIMRRVRGEEHPTTLLAMNNLGAVYRFRGKYSQAEALLTEVLAVRRRILGAQHRDTLATMNSLALVYAVEKKFAQAEQLATEALDGRRRVLGEEHPETLVTMQTLGDIYQMEGNRAEAESWYRKTLDARRKVSGPEHPFTRIALTLLGRIKLEQGQYREAEALLTEAQKGLGTASGATYKRFYGQCLLGASLAGLRKYGEAEPLLLAGYRNLWERRESIPAEERSILDQSRKWIADLYDAWGEPEQAREWRTEHMPGGENPRQAAPGK